MQITTDAIVIKVNDVGDNDRLITLLTKDYGVVKAFASSAKKIKSKYYSGTALFSYSRFILEQVKGTYRVRDASLNNSFFKIGCDISQISLQQYFCELSYILAPMDESSEMFLRLLLNSMYCINNSKMDEALLKAVFELRILSLSGYTPDLVVPVPMAEHRRKERGYNQAELLAQPIARALGAEYSPHMLQRTGSIVQHDLSARLRRLEATQSFALSGKGDAAGKRVLLVDDIFTTGSTLRRCALLLKKAGAAEVVCAAAALTPRKN